MRARTYSLLFALILAAASLLSAGTSGGSAGGASPAGSGSELQVRSTSSAFAAVAGSSVNGTHLILPPADIYLGTDTCSGNCPTGAWLRLRTDQTQPQLNFRSANDAALQLFSEEFIVGTTGSARGGMDQYARTYVQADGRFCFTSGTGNINAGQCDTTSTRAAAGVWKLSDALQLTPRASPPVTCGNANTEGVVYTDSSHALCYCDGTSWAVLTGAGSCA